MVACACEFVKCSYYDMTPQLLLEHESILHLFKNFFLVSAFVKTDPILYKVLQMQIYVSVTIIRQFKIMYIILTSNDIH